MTDREVMQQALKALKTCGEDEWHSEDDFGMVQTYDEDKVAKAISALHTALEQAEPVQENKTLIEWKEQGEAIMEQAGVGFWLGAWWADRPWRQR
jgi:hypothetical protein